MLTMDHQALFPLVLTHKAAAYQGGVVDAGDLLGSKRDGVLTETACRIYGCKLAYRRGSPIQRKWGRCQVFLTRRTALYAPSQSIKNCDDPLVRLSQRTRHTR